MHVVGPRPTRNPSVIKVGEGYGGAFVTAIEGDHSNVLGISVPLLRTLTAQLGIAWTDLWTR
jgi:septum formation protein